MRVIPGGMYGHQATLLLPEAFPQFYRRGEGARVWDADGNEYIDYVCAYGANLLGYGHPDVEAAARAQAQLGDCLSGPSGVMVELAESVVGMIGHAAWAMFCKNGTDATSMAVTPARARGAPASLAQHVRVRRAHRGRRAAHARAHRRGLRRARPARRSARAASADARLLGAGRH
ncbi:MAG TPA: aminotransferase class III-fold pyridoxal phosphate-dependent enzyme [Candidatus Limnocylindria bacterium]|nr:aminotransferase class III-fold pyridoxal phosphate-dependent enzyme [Candidatus Limnocylindria bacterium]